MTRKKRQLCTTPEVSPRHGGDGRPNKAALKKTGRRVVEQALPSSSGSFAFPAEGSKAENAQPPRTPLKTPKTAQHSRQHSHQRITRTRTPRQQQRRYRCTANANTLQDTHTHLATQTHTPNPNAHQKHRTRTRTGRAQRPTRSPLRGPTADHVQFTQSHRETAASTLSGSLLRLVSSKPCTGVSLSKSGVISYMSPVRGT